MKEENKRQSGFSQKEINLMDQLRQQPLIMERVQRILEIAHASEGPLKTADQIEELLIEEVRRLGNATMTEWAIQAQERTGQELKSEDSTVLKRKKKR